MSTDLFGRGAAWPGWILLLLGGLLLCQLGGATSFHSVVSHNNQHIEFVQDRDAIRISDPRHPRAWLVIEARQGGFLKAKMGDGRGLVWCVGLLGPMVNWRAISSVSQRARAFRHCNVLMAVIPVRAKLNHADAGLWLEAHGFMDSPDLNLGSWLDKLSQSADDDGDPYEYSVITMKVI